MRHRKTKKVRKTKDGEGARERERERLGDREINLYKQ
jgi:hypothetical protein